MVRPKRFELLTYRFVACCSIQLSYERVTKKYYSKRRYSSSITCKYFWVMTSREVDSRLVA